MKKYLITIILTVVGLAQILSAQPAKITSFEDALAAAAKANKPILLDLYATWCGPCKQFAKAAESDNDVKKVLESVVLVSIDAEKGSGKDLTKKWKIRAYPSFILFNSKGEPLDRWLGYEKSYFLKTFDDAMRDTETIDEMISRMKSKPNVADAAALGRWYSVFGDINKAVEYYTEAQRLNSDLSFDYTDEIFEVVADGYLENIYKFDDVKTAADNVVRSKNETPEEVYEACQRMITLVVDKNQMELLPGYIKGGLLATSDTTKSEMRQAHNEMMIYEALFVNKDTTKAITYKKGSMPDGWSEKPNQLNEFCWWCFVNKVNLPEAETLSKKSVDMSQPGSDKASYLDTYAQIINARGYAQKAIELTKQAVAMDSTNQDIQDNLTRLQESLKSRP